jgi:arsenite transporter
VPWDTVALSVVLYIVIPLAAGYADPDHADPPHGIEWFDNVFMKRIGPVTPAGLIVTLVLLFAFQGEVILANPLHIVLIAIPLIIQTFLIFFIAYGWAKAWKVPHNVAAPGAMIGASNFFELAVAAAIALFGLQSGAALATVVGVLVEVPLMLALVRIANRTRHAFPEAQPGDAPASPAIVASAARTTARCCARRWPSFAAAHRTIAWSSSLWARRV